MTNPRRAPLEAGESFVVEAALGRLFRMMLRPSREGDVAEYERCKNTILAILEPPPSPLGHVTVGEPTAPNYLRDRFRGAAGD
jgi:hypothetical protein